MVRLRELVVYAALLLFGAAPGGASAQAEGSPRIALVIGNGAYATAPLPTAANDAGLVAQTLAAAGFDVTGARDLDGAALRQAVRDFIDKAASGGPRGIAMVYLAGHALQLDGENYYAPIDAHFDRPADVPIEAFRIADLTRALAATSLGSKAVIIDGAHADPRNAGLPAGGLALIEPEKAMLLAFNAAPGSVAPVEPGPYGVYAKTLTQHMKQGGVTVDEILDRVRVAVNTETGGVVVPWDASRLLQGFTFFDRADNAPARGSAQVPFTSLRTRPLRDFSPEQAYDVAIARDTLPSYQEYLTVFPDNPLARRIRRILALQREALFWREVLRAHSPPAYWTYLRRYPNGPHGAEAGRRLARLTSNPQPPADFLPLAFDVPPPSEEERVVVERRMGLADPDLPPPPPPPLFLLPPLPQEEERPQTPRPAAAPHVLPIPIAVPIPFVRPIIAPGTIMPPRGIKGSYREPRPFMPGPSNGGLVPQRVGDQTGEAPQPEPAPPLTPRPAPAALPEPAVPKTPIVADPAAPHLPRVPKEPAPPTAVQHPAPPAAGAVGVPPPPQGGAEPAVPPTAPPPMKRRPGKGDEAAPARLPAPVVKAAPARPTPPASPLVSPFPAPHPTTSKAAKTPGLEPRPDGKPAEGQPQVKPPPSAPSAPGHAKPQTRSQHREDKPDCGHPGQPPCRP